MTKTWDVIVIGGGLAGLAAAATAAKVGASAVVLEAHAPGGRARTTERDGFVFNRGAHALYLGGEGLRVLTTLGVQPAGSPPPLKRYRLLGGGALHQFPAGASSLLRTSALSARSKATLSKLLVRLPRLDAAAYAGVSVDEWLASYDLQDDADAVARSLIRLATYASDFADLSAEAAVLQLQRAAAKGVLYVDGGWTQLTDALAAGLDVRTKSAVHGIGSDRRGVEVTTADGVVRGCSAVVAVGTPATARSLLGADGAWADAGDPVTAACLDAGVRGVPSPGYVVGLDEPIYGTTQSPPARQAPDGDAVVAVVRYGARSAAEDRPALESWLGHLGVHLDHVVTSRFLARMVVTGGQPRASTGGLRGRPAIDATGMENVFIAGDWVGPHGLLADAALGSGHAAALAALRSGARSTTMVA